MVAGGGGSLIWQCSFLVLVCQEVIFFQFCFFFWCVWYACMCMHVYTCVGTHVWVHVYAQGWRHLSSLIARRLSFWTQPHLVKLASVCQGFPVSASRVQGWQAADTSAWLSCGIWGPELQSTCLYSQCFICGTLVQGFYLFYWFFLDFFLRLYNTTVYTELEP